MNTALRIAGKGTLYGFAAVGVVTTLILAAIWADDEMVDPGEMGPWMDR